MAGGTDLSYFKSIYYWLSIELTAKAAEALGMEDDYRHYASLAAGIYKALLNEFFTPSGRLAVDTQTGYVLSLYYGIYRDKARIISGFHERLKKDDLSNDRALCHSRRCQCYHLDKSLMLPVYQRLLAVAA